MAGRLFRCRMTPPSGKSDRVSDLGRRLLAEHVVHTTPRVHTRPPAHRVEAFIAGTLFVCVALVTAWSMTR